MAYDITDYDELQIYVTDGWREWYIPKFRIFMEVDEPVCYVYWTDTEKGGSGLTRLLALPYTDVTFGYLTPSAASEVALVINQYIISAWTDISGSAVTSVTDDGTGLVDVDNSNPQTPVIGFGNRSLAMLSSGIISGMEVTINGSNNDEFDVSAGFGIIVDVTSDPNNPVLYPITFAGATGIPVTNIGSTTLTHVFIDSSGSIVQTSTEISSAERREYIYLAHIGHTNLTSIGTIVNSPDMYVTPIQQLRDLEEAIGTINLGISVVANGANLKLNRVGGRMYLNGVNFHNDPTDPSFATISSSSAITFRYRTQDGSGSSVTDIDPTSYDVSGTITAIGSTKTSIQRIFCSAAGNVVVQYGQNLYNTFDDAVAAFVEGQDSFVTYENIDEVFVFIGGLVIQSNCADLTDTTRAEFIYADRFGSVGIGGGGSGVQSVTDDGNGIVTVDNTDPLNPVIGFDDSGLNRLYVLDVNAGTSTHTGTTSETITWSFEVPANTIGLNDIIELKTMHRKTTGAAGAHNVRHYMNTSNVVGGGGAITLYNNAQGAAVTIMGETVVKWDNSTTNFVAKPSANAAWGVTSGTAPTTGSISTAASIWFQVTVQLATSTDVVTQYVVELIHHKYA